MIDTRELDLTNYEELYNKIQEIDKFRAHGISVEDSFPVIEGKYTLIILLQNSVQKEFSLSEKEIVIPEDSGIPQIIGPILGHEFQNYQSNVHIPFKVLDKKLNVDPKNIYSSKDEISFLTILTNITEDLWREGRVEAFINGHREVNPIKKTFSLELRNIPFKKTLSLSHSIPARELSPDYYEINLFLSDTRLLNSLGFCYYKTKKVQEALDVLKASLRLNLNQEKIKKLIEEIEKSLN